MMDEEARPGIYLGCGGALCPLRMRLLICAKAEDEVESLESEALSAFDRIC